MHRFRVAIPEIDQNIQNYMDAVQAAGMEPIVVCPQNGQDQRAAAYDGLLLPGGGDIDPARYGEANHGSLQIDAALDALQFAMLEDFVRDRKPVLGICRGQQVINVCFGGTMIQHLPTAFRHSRGDSPEDKVHGCTAEAGSWLAELYGTEFVHNSAHHQAVGRLGEGLVIDTLCPKDGTVEALHHRSLPIYSVQWHPERMCLAHARADTVDGLPVLQFFREILLQNRGESIILIQ